MALTCEKRGAIMENPNDPFRLIQNKVLLAIDACDNLAPNSEQNKEWLPKVVGLLADIEGFIDFILNVDMPNFKKPT